MERSTRQPKTSMDFFDVAMTTPAVRDFSERALDDRTIERILETANMAPSGSNAQPWEFIVIRNPSTKQQLQRLYSELWESYKARAIIKGRSSLSPRAQRALSAGDTFTAAYFACRSKSSSFSIGPEHGLTEDRRWTAFILPRCMVPCSLRSN